MSSYAEQAGTNSETDVRCKANTVTLADKHKLSVPVTCHVANLDN